MSVFHFWTSPLAAHQSHCARLRRTSGDPRAAVPSRHPRPRWSFGTPVDPRPEPRSSTMSALPVDRRRWTTIRSSPCTGAARWRSPARSRSRTTTTCRSRTRPGWPGSAPRSPTTRACSTSYTWAARTVAVVTDGTAVLGLGNIGPRAAMPVMEGKAVLFKKFGGVDAVPICLDTTDPDEIVETVVRLAPSLRRDQPGGHQRAALLRHRGAPAGPPRHPGLPRRPARHGDRRARRAAQRRRG